MDPKHTVEISKHLEKQNQLLTESYKAMSDELHKLQAICGTKYSVLGGPSVFEQPIIPVNDKVEEEMLMRKFYELMSAQGLRKKSGGDNSNGSDDGKNEQLDQ